ncbi:MAG: hypothetical protein KAS12_02495, partial [Candidatus Aenigmarchaeota archaeon]|nr:hypothetical protein [Candidatus Aenigmarchaeota archaeon]
MAPKVLKTTDFKNIYSTQAFYSASSIFGWTLVYLYLVLKNFTYIDLAIFTVITYIAPLLILVNTIKMRNLSSMKLGIALKILTFIAVILAQDIWGLVAVGVLLGASRVFYWVPYNVNLLSLGKNNAGLLSGMAFALPSFFQIVLPALGGIVAELYGFEFVFMLCGLLLVGSMWRTSKIKTNNILHYDSKSSWHNSPGVKTLMVIHGFWQSVNWTAVPLITIFFITNPIHFGTFYTYLGIVGALASIILRHKTDKNKNRQKIIYPTVIILSIATFVSGFTTGIIFWIIARGIISFLDNIAAPFVFSIVVDNHNDLSHSFIAHEISISIGRTLGAIAV